jgi:hypothetical protein
MSKEFLGAVCEGCLSPFLAKPKGEFLSSLKIQQRMRTGARKGKTSRIPTQTLHKNEGSREVFSYSATLSVHEQGIFRSSLRRLSEPIPGEAEGRVPEQPKNSAAIAHRSA